MDARPTSLTKEMKLAAALKLAADVKRDCHDFRGEDINELAEQIADEARGPYMDGYELAKALDNHCGWQPDSTMVETLDMWSRHAAAELRVAQKAWREATNPQPSFKVGDRVKLKDGKAGEITDADYKYGFAQYLVKVDGDPAAETNQSRRIVNYEDAEPIASNPA